MSTFGPSYKAKQPPKHEDDILSRHFKSDFQKSDSIFNIEHCALDNTILEIAPPVYTEGFDILDFFKNIFPAKKDEKEPQKPEKNLDAISFLSPKDLGVINLNKFSPTEHLLELTKPEPPSFLKATKPQSPMRAAEPITALKSIKPAFIVAKEQEELKKIDQENLEFLRKLKETQKCKYIEFLYANANEIRPEDSSMIQKKKLSVKSMKLSNEDNLMLERLQLRRISNPQSAIDKQYGELDEKKLLQMPCDDENFKQLPKAVQKRFLEIKDFIINSTTHENESTYNNNKHPDDKNFKEVKLSEAQFKMMVAKGIWYGEKGLVNEDSEALDKFLNTPVKNMTPDEKGLFTKLKAVD